MWLRLASGLTLSSGPPLHSPSGQATSTLLADRLSAVGARSLLSRARGQPDGNLLMTEGQRPKAQGPKPKADQDPGKTIERSDT